MRGGCGVRRAGTLCRKLSWHFSTEEKARRVSPPVSSRARMFWMFLLSLFAFSLRAALSPPALAFLCVPSFLQASVVPIQCFIYTALSLLPCCIPVSALLFYALTTQPAPLFPFCSPSTLFFSSASPPVRPPFRPAVPNPTPPREQEQLLATAGRSCVDEIILSNVCRQEWSGQANFKVVQGGLKKWGSGA